MSMHPKDLHIGEIFYECNSAIGNVELKAITEPYEEDGSWKWKARHIESGEIIDFIWSGYAYGPDIYDYPAYGKLA